MTADPGPPLDDGAARHLVRGLALPAIALPTTRGDPVSFARLPGWAIVFVYPWSGRPGLPNPPGWDDIPGAHGSTPQAEAIAHLDRAFREQGAAVFAVSGQDTAWQQEFAARMALPFPLVSDADGALQRALALPTFTTGGVRYLKRLTLAVKDGVIVRAFYPVHPPHVHPREVLIWLDEIVTRQERP